MSFRIIIIGDTHVSYFQEIPKQIIEYCKDANWIIHVGDYISEDVLRGFQTLKKNFFTGVYGNSDPLIIRNCLKPKEVIQISNLRIGITHPYFGGPDSSFETKIFKLFVQENLNVIIFGHTHDPRIFIKNRIMLINPGKGYLDNQSINPKASIALLEIGKNPIAKIVQIDH
ncbi:MAG: YfcE family phosphodiesterase [Candidatus Thorarchaeota archaeon]